MSETELKDIIFHLLKNIAPDTEPEKLKPDENIQKALDIDSFDYLQFIVALDEKLGIETPEEDYGKITTLAGLLTYLSAKKK